MLIWKFQRNQTGLETQLKFYIDNCSIKQESVSVNVIEDNCYASGLTVKKISTDKIQPRSSRFSFVAFLTQDSQMQESSMLQCNVNLCVVADNNCVINTVDSQCPNEINYKYTVNGSNWKFWSFLFRKINFINYYYVNFLFMEHTCLLNHRLNQQSLDLNILLKLKFKTQLEENYV